jgi:hypothetical protein
MTILLKKNIALLRASKTRNYDPLENGLDNYE